ncbi:hypothetical protein BamIOP4010DRAFT_4006 [Burkholderia ambifaria IOP40-10]|uniref:Uncharacterized protein n=2 Tax=Burkholderia ambifaria TaxID=152480 RepID=B1FIZ6_9BURK|nr:hypothetical protein BamIOP4010DRAFT_4006 [Burkholderia ambifaria IOP40-10]EDT40796.1 hypothetical protein BamMEX5DRAFT_3429 [Burkholderia ambifaria MEX-5]
MWVGVSLRVSTPLPGWNIRARMVSMLSDCG